MTTLTPPPASLAATVPARRGATAGLRDTAVLARRALRHQVRHIDGLIMGAALPVILLLVFVYVFGGAIAGHTDYLHYVVPGIIVLAGGFGAAQVALAVTDDLGSGTIDRLRAMGTPPAALLGGHVVANLLRNLGSMVLVVALAVAIGFRPGASPLAWLGAVGVAALFILAIASLSVVIGVVAGSPEGASGFTFFVLFLPYLSSAFVPPETLPAALRGLAEHQPVTPVIETMRGLLLSQPIGTAWWRALVWCLGLVAVAVPLAAWLLRRRADGR